MAADNLDSAARQVNITTPGICDRFIVCIIPRAPSNPHSFIECARIIEPLNELSSGDVCGCARRDFA